MSIDEGWTRVKRKSRQNPSKKTYTAEAHHLPETFTPRTHGLLRPPESLRADHDKIRAQWLDSPAHEALIRLVDSHAQSLHIDKAVCLGIGTFDPEDGGREAKRAAYVQLCALSTLTSQLVSSPWGKNLFVSCSLSSRPTNIATEKYSKHSIECIFQEPIFTDSDKSFLTSLGHRVVSSPAAYSLIDNATLLLAVHLYRPIYAAALQLNLPAIFIGTGWDVWDTVTMEHSSDLDNMKKMHSMYSRHAFPQDITSTAFSSTSIYFMPPQDKSVVIQHTSQESTTEEDDGHRRQQ
ncbi:hypothetical protein BBAD15_g11689 [Beauveria bassiana D1-5]|uniref:SRR1-like domain-containing protein n=1 Tax=Beauveria bassiana D1-5 TaxID=1245745 RepID=A0A0A2V6I0_BEABA|nr:hypothetical protein BBAD15_g11689 [Beauveria bassiana D1-5]